MIRFFKKIRQGLLFEGKFGKYLLYATGEIILVVIGILIALAINNANQKRSIREKEQTYLKGLKEEFQTSKLKLAELVKVNQANYRGARQIILYMSNDDEPPTEEVFSQLMYNTFSFDISYNPNNSLLNEMISSGSLKDISNTELRNRLTNWIATMEDISKQEYELGLQREKVLDMFRTNEQSLRTIFDLTGTNRMIELPKAGKKNRLSNLSLLNSTEFENNILMFILTSYATEKTHYEPLMGQLDSILAMLNTEIQR
ncbi:DUF6090 family protein [Salegentibacter chungangensis]|uniref:DUF6090 family protein n=1 Tax=Salegentibacter chungangensis TaxID=1335724 RepID=A0ABW3NSG2_9FLAO